MIYLGPCRWLWAKNVLERTKVDDFEQFELVVQQALYNGAFVGRIPPNMACLEYSAVLHNSCDKVSDYKVTRYDNTELGINHRYMDGMRIQYNDFDFSYLLILNWFLNNDGC